MANNVRYESNAKNVKHVMSELERAALKETAKFLRKEIKAKVQKKSGVLRKNVGSWVKKSDASLQIGVYDHARAKRKGYTYAFHAHLIEFGTRFSRAFPFLRPSVMDNIDKIRELQAKYLPAIEDEIKARRLIDESEEIADD